MSEQSSFSPETAAAVEALIGSISVARALDTEIRAELHDHIEDKIRAYLAGEEKLTERDALHLAQAHFGNPATIQGLFARAQRNSPARPRRRHRLATVALAAGLPVALAMLAGDWLMTAHAPFYPSSAAPPLSGAIMLRPIQCRPEALPKGNEKYPFNGTYYYLLPIYDQPLASNSPRNPLIAGR